MPTLFSKSCTYAIQATLYLSSSASERPVHLGTMSHALGIPQQFLSKILQKLVHDGILESRRGSHGGFGLGRPARDISLKDIMCCVDGTSWQSDCLMGFQRCAAGDPCVLHLRRSSMKQTVDAMLSRQNIASLRNRGTLTYLKRSNEPEAPHDRSSAVAR